MRERDRQTKREREREKETDRQTERERESKRASQVVYNPVELLPGFKPLLPNVILEPVHKLCQHLLPTSHHTQVA